MLQLSFFAFCASIGAIIFLLVGMATLLPLLYPVGLPVYVSPEVQKIYDYVEAPCWDLDLAVVGLRTGRQA